MLSDCDKEKACSAQSWFCLYPGQPAPSLVSPDEEDSNTKHKDVPAGQHWPIVEGDGGSTG